VYVNHDHKGVWKKGLRGACISVIREVRAYRAGSGEKMLRNAVKKKRNKMRRKEYFLSAWGEEWRIKFIGGWGRVLRRVWGRKTRERRRAQAWFEEIVLRALLKRGGDAERAGQTCILLG